MKSLVLCLQGFDANESKWKEMVDQVRAEGTKALQDKDAEVGAH